MGGRHLENIAEGPLPRLPAAAPSPYCGPAIKPISPVQEQGESFMRYKLHGRSGLRVSELCLGAMTFGNTWGWGGGDSDSRAMFDAFAEAGGNFIDTAYVYTEGDSERLVGEFIATDRDHFVVATKYTPSTGTDISKSGNSRKNMRHCVETSLKRMKTDYIDLYLLHFWDYTT